MKISNELLKYLEDMAENYNYELTTDYSGRFMYGKICIGFISSNDSFLIDLIDNCQDKIKKELKTMLKTKQVDNMGLDYIYYFPEFQK